MRGLLILALALAACSADGAPTDDTPDDQDADTAPADEDSGPTPSPYTSDASTYDAGHADASKPDAGTPSGFDASPLPEASTGTDASPGPVEAGGGGPNGCCINDEPYACPSSVTCPEDVDTCIQKCNGDPQCIQNCLNMTAPPGCTPDPNNYQVCGF
jgi:hypothetical protein